MKRHQSNRELISCFFKDFPIQANLEEIQDARFWEIDDIKNSLGKQLFTPNFEDEFTKLLSHPDIIQFLHP